MKELNSTLEMINLNVKVEGTRVCKRDADQKEYKEYKERGI